VSLKDKSVQILYGNDTLFLVFFSFQRTIWVELAV